MTIHPKHFVVAMNRIKRYIRSVPYDFDEGIQSHPFFQTPFARDFQTRDMVQITKSNFPRLLEQALNYLEENMRKDFSFFTIFVNKPYRIPLLMEVSDLLDEGEYNEILRDVWTDTEFPHQNGVAILVVLFDHAKRELLMEKDDYKVFQQLPSRIQVYRGIQNGDAIVRGLSWSLSKGKAEWFAQRWSKKGALYRAEIAKEHVYAYFNERGEEEIVLNPQYLKNVEKVI